MAAPADVLAALRAHLAPAPLVQLLPTALQLFSHVCLLADAVRREASAALAAYDAGRGALHAPDVRLLHACAAHSWGELYALSLDVRRSHVARSLQNYGLSRRAGDLERIAAMVQSYFPALPPGRAGAHAAAGSRLLYVRCMREGDFPLLAQYRAQVEGWMADPAQADLECSEELHGLAARMLETAERVVGHAEALEQLFGGSRPSRRESLPSAPSRKTKTRPRHTEPVLSH